MIVNWNVGWISPFLLAALPARCWGIYSTTNLLSKCWSPLVDMRTSTDARVEFPMWSGSNSEACPAFSAFASLCYVMETGKVPVHFSSSLSSGLELLTKLSYHIVVRSQFSPQLRDKRGCSTTECKRPKSLVCGLQRLPSPTDPGECKLNTHFA